MSNASVMPVLRALFGMPVLLYRCGGGWLLGRRFLMLNHVGRRSGRRRSTVLEIIAYREATGDMIVISGFGRNAGWLRNIQANPAAEVVVGSACFAVSHRFLDTAEAAEVLAAYERRHLVMAPVVRVVLSRLLGWRYDGSPEARRRAVTQLPLIAFRPVDRSAGSVRPVPAAVDRQQTAASAP